MPRSGHLSKDFPSILAVDSSLTCTGVAYLRDGTVEVASLRTKKTDHPPGLDTISRVSSIVSRVDFGCDLMIIESPSHNSRFGKPHERSHLWWQLVDEASKRGCEVYTLSPKSRAKFATNNGNAKKDEVVYEVRKHFDVANDNEADSIVLGFALAHYLGHPHPFPGTLSKGAVKRIV